MVLWVLLWCFQGPLWNECKNQYSCRDIDWWSQCCYHSWKQDGNRPEQLLEQFWLELADSFIDLENVDPFLSPYMERLMANFHYFSPSGSLEVKNESKRKVEDTRTAKGSFISSAMFGNDKMFKVRWRPEYALTDPQYFEPAKLTSPLAATSQRYIDYDKLKPNGNSNSRLIMTMQLTYWLSNRWLLIVIGNQYIQNTS